MKMSKNMSAKIVPSLLFALMTSVALADIHFDISPENRNGTIFTNGVTHASLENPFTGQATPEAHNYFTADLRVFGYEFGENPSFPTWTEDPGINCEPGTYLTQTGSVTITGTLLPLGSQLYLNILSDLQYWTGDGFSAVPNQETLTIGYGPTIRTVGTGTGALPGLLTKTFSTSDTVHLHLDANLYDSSGGDQPTPGIYMFEGKLHSSSPLIADSLPFWVLYNFAASEDDHQAAMEWVQSNLVPEPVSLALLLLGLPGLRRRA